MRRTTIAIASVLTLVLAAPGTALADHHHRRGHGHAHGPGRHGRHRGLHHAKGARVLRFDGSKENGGVTTSTEGTEAESIGTIASFEDEVLTIKLIDGSTVSGKVTEDTRIACVSSTPSEATDDQSEGAGDGPGQGWQKGHGSSFGGSQGNDGKGFAHCCEKTALVPGSTVREAELRLTSSGSTWEAVVLMQ